MLKSPPSPNQEVILSPSCWNAIKSEIAKSHGRMICSCDWVSGDPFYQAKLYPSLGFPDFGFYLENHAALCSNIIHLCPHPRPQLHWNGLWCTADTVHKDIEFNMMFIWTLSSPEMDWCCHKVLWYPGKAKTWGDWLREGKKSNIFLHSLSPSKKLAYIIFRKWGSQVSMRIFGIQHRSRLTFDYQWYSLCLVQAKNKHLEVARHLKYPALNLVYPSNHINGIKAQLKECRCGSGSGLSKSSDACPSCSFDRYPKRHYHDVIYGHAHPGWKECWHYTLYAQPENWM